MQTMTLGEIKAKLSAEGFAQFQKDINNADKSMSGFSKNLKSFGDQATKIGKTLTKNVTLPIVGLGAAAVKFAADAEVSFRKFGKAFEGTGSEATDVLDNLNKNFGLSNTQATQLLANVGDLLKGFGSSSSEALQMSDSVLQLSSALSAYNGVPVARAADAIKSALVGERDALKGLGIVVSEAAVQKQLLSDGTADLTGQELLLAKAQATLKLAYQQSGDAVGSFAENQNTLAFQSQQLLGDLKDLGVEFGTILLPVMKDIVGEIKQAVEWFSNLTDEQKKSIIKAAAIAAALGPVITSVGQLTTAVRVLSTAFNGPVGLAIAIGAATAALALWIRKKHEAKVEEFAKEIDDTTKRVSDLTGTLYDNGDATKALEESYYAVGTAFKNWTQQQQLSGFESVETMADLEVILGQIEQNYGIARDEAILLASENSKVSDGFKEMLAPMAQAITLQKEQNEDVNQLRQLSKEHAESRIKARKEAQTESVVTADITDELTQQEQIRKSIEEKYLSAYDEYRQIIAENDAALTSSGNRELDRLDEQIAYYEFLANGSEAYNKARASALEILYSKRSQLVQQAADEELTVEREKAAEINAINEDSAQRYINLNATKIQQLEYAKQQELLAAQETGESRYTIEAYYDQLINDEKSRLRDEEIEKAKETYITIASFAESMVGNLSGLFNSYYQNQIGWIEYEKSEQIAALDEQGLSDEEYADKKAEIDKKAAQEEYDLKLKAWKTQKALDTTQTIISTSLGAMRAYSAMAGIPGIGPFLGMGAAAAVTALGLIKVALINSQPPPPKPFAEGGYIPSQPGGINAQIGEGRDDEVVFPLNDETFRNLGASIVEAQQATTSPIENNINNSGDVIIVVDGSPVARLKNGVQDLLDSRKLNIPGELIS